MKLLRSLGTKKGRDRARLFVAEGRKVCGDLLSAGFQAVYMAVEEGQPMPCVPPSCEVATASADELRRVSFLQHPQGLLSVFALPDTAWQKPQENGLYLALDGVQDPGNLGTIIRVADWFGIDGIYCSPDTADCWNPKVVQATMGSIARVPIYYTDLTQLAGQMPAAWPVYGTLLDGHDLYHEPLSTHGLIVMGNEGNGISPEMRARVNRRLLIPNWPKGRDTAESLNVAIATAITCAEFRRRQQ